MFDGHCKACGTHFTRYIARNKPVPLYCSRECWAGSNVKPKIVRVRKRCGKCSKVRPVAKFGKDSHRRDGLNPYCKECLAAGSRMKRADPAWIRNKRHKLYGITPEEQVAMYKRQKGRCAICGTRAGEFDLCLDHCHRKNTARGFLCAQCNVGLGSFRDDIDRLEQAILYLELNI